VSTDGEQPVAKGRAAAPLEGESEAREPLEASLVAQLELLWRLELGDTPMAVQFEPSSSRA